MRGMGIQSESIYDRQQRERLETELKIKEDRIKEKIIAKEAERDNREKEGLDINRESLEVSKKSLKKADLSLWLSIIAIIIALLSFIKMFF